MRASYDVVVWRTALLGSVAVAGAMAVGGCHSSSTSAPCPSPTGNYTFTLNYDQAASNADSCPTSFNGAKGILNYAGEGDGAAPLSTLQITTANGQVTTFDQCVPTVVDCALGASGLQVICSQQEDFTINVNVQIAPGGPSYQYVQITGQTDGGYCGVDTYDMSNLTQP